MAALFLYYMLKYLFLAGYIVITLLFCCCGIALIAFAIIELKHGITLGREITLRQRLNGILESIGILTIAVAAFELGQTIFEEEVQRKSHLSAPTRVRRFVSRFMVVLIVSLAIESLVAAFKFAHESPDKLPFAAMIAIAAAFLLTSWGVFVRLNSTAEKLEPEAMTAVKKEDHQIEI